MQTGGRTDDLMIAPARPGDASDIAVLMDMAGNGLPSHFWATAQDRSSGVSLLEIGRRRVLRDSGSFSWRNAWIARAGTDVAGMMLGYRQPDDLSSEDSEDMPAPVRPLIELEAEAPGSWYLNAMAVYPEHRGKGIARALLDQANEAARQEDARQISLIVEDLNERAMRLYAAAGFRTHASRPFATFPGGPEAKAWMLMVREVD